MEIQLYSKLSDPLDAIDRMGEYFAKSGMFGCTRLEQGKVLAMICLTMHKTPVDVLATYHIIEGQLSKKALACLAELRARGGKHKWINPGFDGKAATGQFSYEGETIEVTFTIEDAERQGLVKPRSNWQKTPANMLRARCITTAIGMLAPEIFSGSADDIDDSAVPTPTKDFNLGQEPAPAAQPAPPPPPQTPEAKKTEAELDAHIEAKMGLAPVKKEPAAAPPRRPQPMHVEPGDEGPMPPPSVKTVEPEVLPPGTSPAATARRSPLVPPNQLSVDTVEQMGNIFEGHFLEVATWMIKQKWIPPADKELRTEQHAVAHLQFHLPTLSPARARRVLKQKMAFMRAVQEINP